MNRRSFLALIASALAILPSGCRTKNATETLLISGGMVTWTGGATFEVSPAVFTVKGKPPCSSPGGKIEVARTGIQAIYVMCNGKVGSGTMPKEWRIPDGIILTFIDWTADSVRPEWKAADK